VGVDDLTEVSDLLLSDEISTAGGAVSTFINGQLVSIMNDDEASVF